MGIKKPTPELLRIRGELIDTLVKEKQERAVSYEKLNELVGKVIWSINLKDRKLQQFSIEHLMECLQLLGFSVRIGFASANCASNKNRQFEFDNAHDFARRMHQAVARDLTHFRDSHGWSNTESARRCRVEAKRVSEVLNLSDRITMDCAIDMMSRIGGRAHVVIERKPETTTAVRTCFADA